MLPASELSRSRYPDNSSLPTDVLKSVEGRTRLVPVEEWSSDLSICITSKPMEEVPARIQDSDPSDSTKTRILIAISIDFAALRLEFFVVVLLIRMSSRAHQAS